MNGVGRRETMVYGCRTGRPLQMLGRLAPYYSTVAARNLAKETANEIELESAAQHFANVKADV